MKRFFVILVAFVIAMSAASPKLSADSSPLISHFSISLYSPSQKKLVPLVVCDEGKFSVSRRARLTRGSLLHVKLTTVIPGKWVSVAFRDTYGNIYDLPYSQRKMTQNSKEIIFRVPGRFPPGEVEAFLCLWGDFDELQNANENAMYMTQWMNVGECNI